MNAPFLGPETPVGLPSVPGPRVADADAVPGGKVGRDPHLALSIGALACLYGLGGWLGLLLAVPPGYATVIWPASGLALAGLLLFGRGLWPGILLGSFTVNAVNGHVVAGTEFQLVPVINALMIAAGSTLQALLADSLVRRRFGLPIQLNSNGDVLRLAVYVGPLACLIGASVGVSSLYLTGILPIAAIPQNWATWWVGDLAGILVILPILLFFPWAQHKVAWKGRAIAPFTATMVIGLFVLLGATMAAWKITSVTTYERNLATFQSLAADNEQALRHRLASYAQSLDGGAALFQSSTLVTMDDWRIFVEELNVPRTLPGINGIGYIEAVARKNVQSYLDGIKDRGLNTLTLHPHTDMGEIFAITLIEPIAENREAVGLDIAFEENRRAAAIQARDTGHATITRRIYLVQDATRSSGFLLLRPMYRRGTALKTIQQRREAFSGWIYAPFVANRFMDGLTASQGRSVNIAVYDGKAASAENLIYSSGSAGSGSSAYSTTQTISVMQQHWTVVWNSTPEFEGSVGTKEPLLILAGGLLLTFVFGILLLSYSRREAYVRHQVAIKTFELTAKERENQSIVDTALAGILVVDENHIILSANKTADQIFGRRSGSLVGDDAEQLLGDQYRQLMVDDAGARQPSNIILTRKADSSEFYVDAQFNPWMNEAGARRATIILRDVTDAHRLSIALTDAERRWKFALDGAKMGVFDIDLDAGQTFVSMAWKSMFGLPIDAPVDPTEWFNTHIHPDERQEVLAAYEACSSGKTTRMEIEHRIQHVDGHWIWVRGIALLMADPESGNRRLIGAQTDVTDLKLAMEGLRESEQRFGALAGLSPAGIFSTDAYGFCTYVNDAWLLATGLSAASALGAGWLSAVHIDDRSYVQRQWLNAIADGADYRAELRLQHEDGSLRWVSLICAPGFDDLGRVNGYIGVAIDETEQKLADMAHAERAEQLSLLAANMTDGVLRLDMQGICTYASPSIHDIIGVTAELCVGMDMMGHFHPDEEEATKAAYLSLIQGKTDRIVVSHRAQHASRPGEWVWLESHAGLLQDETGAPAGIIVSIRNIDERKQLEQDIATALDHAEAATRAKSSFLANMSHEIRTPMNGVLGFTHLLLASDLNATQQHHARLISQSGKTMLALLNDILDLSKIDAGQLDVTAEPVALHDLIHEAATLMQPAAQQKNLLLSTDINDAVPGHIITDPLRLRQLIANLLGNAVKFTMAGAITLCAKLTDDDGLPHLTIMVSDTGIGIPADRHDAIFGEFVQSSANTAHKFGGTGLGLAISHRLALLMGGGLILERSEPGVGSTFRLTLPLEVAATTECVPAPSQALAQRVSEPISEATADTLLLERILIVEDHPINQQLLSAQLKQLGYTADIAQDGQEGVDQVLQRQGSQHQYALVLMDMQMPRLDGPGAARRIRDAGIDATTLPILAITANAFEEDIQICLDAGMQDHLAKPLVIERLDAALRTWIRTTAKAQSSPAAVMSAVVEELRERFNAFLGEGLALVATALNEPVGLAPAALREYCHKLGGTAATFGAPELGHMAQKVEAQLVENGIVDTTQPLIRAFAEALSATQHG